MAGGCAGHLAAREGVILISVALPLSTGKRPVFRHNIRCLCRSQSSAYAVLVADCAETADSLVVALWSLVKDLQHSGVCSTQVSRVGKLTIIFLLCRLELE